MFVSVFVFVFVGSVLFEIRRGLWVCASALLL